MQTLLQKLDRLPPCLCRLMAKGSNGKLASNAEIKRRTGFGKSKLRRVSSATTFKNVTVGEVDAFLAACGLRWSTQRRLLWLLQRTWRNHGAVRPDWVLAMRHLSTTKTGWQASMVRRHQRRIEKLLSKK
jgi:hypothetical protein